MSNLQRHKDCTMRAENGNCLAIGGFCTSVSKEICEALQNAYKKGRHSVEVSEDCISREYMLKLQRELHGWMSNDKNHELWQKIKEAPSVVPSRAEGEWKFKKIFSNDDSEFPMGYLVCSVCGSQHANATPCNYCDNCGAKMKGTDDERVL